MTADYPKSYHIPRLRRLWKEAFGDTDVFLDGFFAHGFDVCRCRCMLEEDVPVAALYWFEVTCSGQRFAYLYAVATAVSHRGRGLFSNLLEDTKKVLAEAGFDGILLHPETEALGKMYEKLGFSPCAAVEILTVTAVKENVAVREIGPQEFMDLRRNILPEGAAEPGKDMLRFLASQYRFWAGEGYLASGQVYDGKLVCQEFLGDTAAAGGLAGALGAAEGYLRMPGKMQKFVYVLPLRDGCAAPEYFPFALD